MAGTWGAQQATSLLGKRSSQVTWMRTFQFQAFMEEYLLESRIKDHMRGETAQAILSQALISQWSDGKIFVLSAAAAAAVRSAAATMLGDSVAPPLRAENIPCPTALVAFPTDMYSLGHDDSNVPLMRGVSAMSWSPCYVAPGVEGSLVASWTHRDSSDDDMLIRHRDQGRIAEEVARETAEAARNVRAQIARDTASDAEELRRLDEAVSQELRQARSRQRRASQAVQSVPEFVLEGMAPVPIGLPFKMDGRASEAGRDRQTCTVPVGEPDPDAATFPVRLLHGLCGLMRAELLVVSAVSLPPNTKKRYAKRGLPHDVLGVDVAFDSGGSSVVTVTKERVETPTMKGASRLVRWSVEPFLGGKVML